MGRPRDEFYRKQVTIHKNGICTCNHCGKKFKGGVSRIKAHLGNRKGLGITLCTGRSVPINEGANSSATATAMPDSSDPMQVVDGMNSFQVATQAHYTIDDNIPSSSHHQNVILANNSFEVARYPGHIIDGNITNFEDHQNVSLANNLLGAEGAGHEVNDNDMEHFLNDYTGPTHTSQDDVVGNDNGGFESEISQIGRLIDMLTSEKAKIQREFRTGQKRRSEIEFYDWLEKTEGLIARANKMIVLLSGQDWSLGRSAHEVQIKELIDNLHSHVKEKPLELPNELMVGKSFRENLKDLSRLVRDDKVLLIGVHGMGGVGKTTLVTHFKNEALRKRYFEHVIWVTVSQDFSVFKLQSAIAKRIGIQLDEDDEIVERAQILSLALEKKSKVVLILDDVWNYIDLRKVGIPLRVNRIKLILTSRLKHVFQQMDCPLASIIQIMTLPRFEDWKLFLLKLGSYGTPATLSPETEKIATSIVERCDGLPLGISVMARIMKGVNDIRQWRHALNKLENSSMGGEIEDEVFKSLKLSYDHLMDKNIQNCFLVCSLYTKISKNEFIMKLVDEGLIKEMKSLEEIFDEGHAILDQLKGYSLLFVEYLDGLTMNDLTRDMASYVVKGRHMVKIGSLTKVPDIQEWARDLEKVSLMVNDIEEIPEGKSPSCPQLSTLNLSRNYLSQIPECFFSYMDALTILDLSYNEKLTCLPNSLSRLRSLKSLLLQGCVSLKHVPPLWELLKLTRLVISSTSIERVPEGLAMLVKLRWLDLSLNYNLTFEPWSIPFGLTNVQYLELRSSKVIVEVENVKRMSVLEYFSRHFHTTKDFIDYVENILDSDNGPKYYYLVYGIYSIDLYKKLPDLLEVKDRQIHFEDCEAFNRLLPRNFYVLHISDNQQWSEGLCDVVSFKAPSSSSLRKIYVSGCPKLERLFCLSGSCSLCKHLHNLHLLSLYDLERLDVIWTETDDGISLSNLSHLSICECHNMEKLLTPVALRQLLNLEKIHVKDCESMKKIFATKSSDEDDNNNNSNDSTITFPKSFKRLELVSLLRLEIVSTSIIVCESPPTLQVNRCPNLKQDSVRYKSSLSHPNIVTLKLI